VDYSFVTNKKNKQTLFACVCVLVERRFRILQITKIYAESVFVNKRALERVRVRRDCDDVSNEKFGFFFISHRNQKQKQPTPQKVKKVKKQASEADFEARSKKKRGEMKSRYRKTTIIKRIKTTENMLKKVDVSTRIAPVLSSF
jgi:chromatin remodeling complex protein RSC6